MTRGRAAVLVVMALVLVGAGGRKNRPEVVTDEVAPLPVANAEEPTFGKLFPAGVPLDPGPIPKGLPSLSAQGCNGCHPAAHDGWAASAHAGGASPTFEAAANLAGTPACRACHSPLVAQQPDRVLYEGGDVNHPKTAPNPAFDATLSTEGVTCAACHVRDGMVITSRPVASAPHPTAWSADLASPEACATCHELSWPGADRPLYDTYGEWSTSPHAKAGIGCVACHMAGAADASIGANHAFSADPGRAVSLLVNTDRVQLTRGGPPLAVAIRVQNTGAGHAFPTGSPWGWVRVHAALMGPIGKNGAEKALDGAFTADLRRSVEATAPWRTVADTRVAAGAEAGFAFTPSLPVTAPAGPWYLEVSLVRYVGDQPEVPPITVQRIPLRVD